METAEDPTMFSDLTTSELQLLFAVLGGVAEVGNYGVHSEITDVQLDVHQALHNKVHAERAEWRARAEAPGERPRAASRGRALLRRPQREDPPDICPGVLTSARTTAVTEVTVGRSWRSGVLAVAAEAAGVKLAAGCFGTGPEL